MVLNLNPTSCPKMKEVKTAYHRVILERHPDRNDGNDKGFDEAKVAYDYLCEYIKDNIVNDDESDAEEILVRKEFLEANVVKLNKNSVTIKPLSKYLPMYEEVLSEEYGEPVDSSAENHGNKFANKNDVFITTYWKPKERFSTIYVQGKECLSFVENILPGLFAKVVDRLPLSLRSDDNNVPNKRKRQDKPEEDVVCDECPITSKNNEEMKKHKAIKHTKVGKKSKRLRDAKSNGQLIKVLRRSLMKELNESIPKIIHENMRKSDDSVETSDTDISDTERIDDSVAIADTEMSNTERSDDSVEIVDTEMSDTERSEDSVEIVGKEKNGTENDENIIANDITKVK